MKKKLPRTSQIKWILALLCQCRIKTWSNRLHRKVSLHSFQISRMRSLLKLPKMMLKRQKTCKGSSSRWEALHQCWAKKKFRAFLHKLYRNNMVPKGKDRRKTYKTIIELHPQSAHPDREERARAFSGSKSHRQKALGQIDKFMVTIRTLESLLGTNQIISWAMSAWKNSKLSRKPQAKKI